MEEKIKRAEAIGTIDGEVEFVERLAGVTEELENLVEVSKGKRKLESPVISKRDIMSVFRPGKQAPGIPKSLLSIFRLLVVKNLLRGRFFTTSYNSGREIGLSASLKSKNDFVNATRRLGLGKAVITKFRPDKIEIRLHDGITSMGIRHSPRPICFFEAGIFAGFLENIFRKKMNLKEIKCRTMGDPYCQFDLSRVKYEPYKGYPPFPADIYSQENLKLLTSLASHSITAIENAILFEKTRQQVVVDGLTQVYNHRYFHQRLDVEYKRAQRYNFPITFFMLDVDNFKKFNDRYGHPKGDEVLKTVALTLVKNLRSVDIIARYGGDEFAVILPQTDEHGAKIVAERIRNEISQKRLRIKKEKTVGMTISLGGVSFEPATLKGKTGSRAVEIADKALLKAKRKGKNNIVFFERHRG